MVVNFKLGKEMWKVLWLIWHERGTKKKSESPTEQESNPWPPEQL